MDGRKAMNCLDFSREGNFQERLLKRIKAECFAELDDADLAFVNAAGANEKVIGIVMPDLNN